MLDKLKPVVQLDSVMAISKTAGWLREQLETRRDALLVMDCRAQELYESAHVETAINVAIPSLMLRRLKKGNLPVRSLLSDGEDRERFVRRCKTDTIVLYDEYSREWNENVDGGSVLGLLLRRMKDEGYKAFYLEGKRREREGGERGSFTFQGPVNERGRRAFDSQGLVNESEQFGIEPSSTTTTRHGLFYHQVVGLKKKKKIL